MNGDPLLQVDRLCTYFKTRSGYVRSVDDISFVVHKKEILGIVGESGSGKSVTAYSILKILPKPQGQIVSGSILYHQRNLVELSETQMRNIRGNEISMIFQEPMTSLNPVYTIKDQISEAILVHTRMSKKEAESRVVELLARVGIPDAGRRAKSYPHELSGGMRQRVMIAMALSCNPQLLIADEPTTALDVTIQAQILDLILSLQKDIGMSVVLITHDLGVIAETTERVIVMYAGKILESARTSELFEYPFHPYTRGLLDSIPSLNKDKKRLYSIPGMVPSAAAWPKGCRFHNRCVHADDTCRTSIPPLEEVREGHLVSCWKWEKL